MASSAEASYLFKLVYTTLTRNPLLDGLNPQCHTLETNILIKLCLLPEYIKLSTNLYYLNNVYILKTGRTNFCACMDKNHCEVPANYY